MGLFDSEGAVPSPEQVPAWMLAGDNHNIGNTDGGSWIDPDTWSKNFSGAGKMISSGMLSGLNSFYNSGVTLGRFLGATNQEDRDTGEWISAIDQDLGEYYRQNTGSADLIGFIASSLLPGVGGIKVLNAGQRALTVAADTGKFGSNMSMATKLLAPRTEMYIQRAAKEITEGTNIFSSINTSGVKALAAGVQQNVLEGLAFEMMVQATMFKSPILEPQDTGDIVKNLAIGGIFGGVLGGSITAATSLGAIKREVVREQQRLNPLSSRTQIQAATSLSAKIVLMADDAENAVKVAPDDPNIEAANKLFNDKMRRIDLDIRDNINQMALGESVEITNMLADATRKAAASDMQNTFLFTEQVGGVKKITRVENEMREMIKKQQIPEGMGVKYVKLTGEDAGKVSEGEPLVISLADSVIPKKGQTTQDAVLNHIRGKGFKVSDGFSTANLTKMSAHIEAEARYLWAEYSLKGIPDGSVINQSDFPVLERALKDGKLDISITDDAGKVVKDSFASTKELFDHIVEQKQVVYNRLIEKAIKSGADPLEFSTESIAKIVNTKLSRMEGTKIGPDSIDFFARQQAINEYASFRQAKGLISDKNVDTVDPAFLPSYAKLSYRIPEDAALDGHVIDGLTYLKQQQKQFELQSANVTAKYLGEFDAFVPKITDQQLLGATTTGSGATLIGFENSTYGTLGSAVANIGNITRQVKQAMRKRVEDSLQGPLALMGQKLDASIEHATIGQKITRSGELWKQMPAELGEGQVLVTKKALDAALKDENFAGFDPKDLIQVKNKETWDVITAEIGLSSKRTDSWTELNAAMGKMTSKDAEVYRPNRPDLKDYPFFAFVKDARVTGSGHTTMLHANSAEKLDELVNAVKLKNPQLTVITKTESDDWFRARHEYEYSRSLNENYLNPELANKGIFSEFFTKTDPHKIINDVLNSNLRDEDVLAVEMMRLKNQAAFDWLEDQGTQFTKIEASKFGSSLSRIEREGKNPYTDFIKTALDISKASEHPLIYGFNKALDSAVSVAKQRVDDVFTNAKSVEDMIEINSLLDKYGMNTAYRNAATDLLVNHSAPKGELTKFIRGANALLAKLTLGLDPLNALNNLIGANILRGTELKQITDAIKTGDESLAGELAKLTKVQVPGTDKLIIAPSKLIQNAITNYVKDDGKLVAKYQAAGYIKDASTQFKSILDDFTLQGTETVADLNSRLNRAFQKAKSLSEVGEKFTGNRHAEEMNRFISANVMDQLTSLAVKRGLMSEAESAAYINTFVNRVEGNTIASQRPIIFQGPIGQALGLFQSYQFNLMQQMFRYVAEGSKKDAAMLLGLQGTFFGLQGLPAFQFINQNVVGSLSGNTEHRDLYDAAFGVTGKRGGEFLLYGLPSNLLHVNLYTRGDINPRQVTVIPNELSQVPIVGAYSKFFGSMFETAKKISGGAPVVESMLQGLEHNGLNRPMAGIAQTLQAFGNGGEVYSTSKRGNIVSSNDLFSWATATRLAGGKPLDEAIVNDAVYRIHAYKQDDRAKMNRLSETVRTSVIAGNFPEGEQIGGFAAAYAAVGGKQANFNSWFMNQYKNANTAESERIANQLANPLAQKMQTLLGTSEGDF